MKNFVEELFYGNLEPLARYYAKGYEIKIVLESIFKIEQQLTAELTENQKLLFDKYYEENSKLSQLTNLDSFMEGFRYGAKFMLDTFVLPDIEN